MRRSLRVQRLPVAPARAERLVVASSLMEPERGLVVCGAAPAIAAGLACRESSVCTAHLDARVAADDGVMWAASFVDRRGKAGGFGVLARSADAGAVAVAERTVREWADVVRSRCLLIAEPPRMCPGAQRALNMMRRAADREARAVIGRPVTDHDGPREAMPLVAALRDRFPELGGHHFDILCDHTSDHAQTTASVTASSDLTLVLTSETRPGTANEAVDGRGCHALAGRHDRPGAAGEGRSIRIVRTIADLTPGVLADATTIGLIIEASSPRSLPRQVREVLSGLGPLSTRYRQVRTHAGANAPVPDPW
jgi:hypothetical protein